MPKVSSKHHSYLIEALHLAKQSIANQGGPFGALVVHNGIIVGRGNNQVTKALDPSAHAEIVAIRDACQKLNHFQLTDCILYASSEPCPMCLSAIYWARIKQVYFVNPCAEAASIGFDDRFIYQQIGLQNVERDIPFIHAKNNDLIDLGKSVFSSWQNKTDKIEY